MAEKLRAFPLDVVLTITTQRLVATQGISAVYGILDYMTRDTLFGHQLPRAARECSPWLLRWHPALADVRLWLLDQLIEESTLADSSDSWPLDACQCWIDIERERLELPTELAIERIPQDAHERKDPYDELVAMRGTDEGIVLVVKD